MRSLLLAFSLAFLTPHVAAAADPPQPAAAAPPPTVAPPLLPFLLFSETQVGYYVLPTNTAVGVTGGRNGNGMDGRVFPSNVLTINNANAWAYGTNFVGLEVGRSGAQNPAGVLQPNFENFGHGAAGYAFVYRGTLSGNALTGSTLFSVPGLIKDVSIAFGSLLQADNSLPSGIDRQFVGGLGVALDVPVGFVSLTAYAMQENIRLRLAPAASHHTYDTTAQIDLAYNIPLAFTQLPLSVAGFATVVLPRGRDPAGIPTVVEWISRTNLVLDVGALLYDQPNRLKTFAGFQYRRNSGGADFSVYPGAEVKSVLVGFSMTIF